jgi:hypothetical protein
MKKILAMIVMLSVVVFSADAWAKLSQPVWDAIQQTYTPAVPNPTLDTAYQELDKSKLRSFVVVERGGIATARAKRFITWAEYDYRGVTIDLKKETVKNRRGKTYAYLQHGDVMAVAKLDKFLNTVYVSLISPDVYKPANRLKDKKFSRVTTTISFKLPKEIAESDDPTAALAAMGDWLKSFTNYDSAVAYSQGATGVSLQMANVR